MAAGNMAIVPSQGWPAAWPPADLSGRLSSLRAAGGEYFDEVAEGFGASLWVVLESAVKHYLGAISRLFWMFFATAGDAAPCTDEGTVEGAFFGGAVGSGYRSWATSCADVQRFDLFVCCALFVTTVGGFRVYRAWEPNSILGEGVRFVLGWATCAILALSASGYALPLLCVLKGFADHRVAVLVLSCCWAALEWFPYKRLAYALWPLVASRTRVVAFTSISVGSRVIRGGFKTKREAHSTISDATWCDLPKEPMLKGHVKVCVRKEDGSAFVHSAMQVGENCALCCAHAVKDPMISIQTAYEAGHEIFLVPYGEPITSKTKCRTMPAYVLEGLKNPHNIWTPWRDVRDNATVRDFAVFYFRDAGSRYEGAVSKQSFRHTYQPEAKVATYRAAVGNTWKAQCAGTNLTPIAGEPGMLASSLGSDPGMSGAPVFTISPGGGGGRFVGMNLGQDPEEGGLVLNSATIRHHLLKKGFLSQSGKTFRWNDDWENTCHTFKPAARHGNDAGVDIDSFGPTASKISDLLPGFGREAHASKSWRTMNASERRDSDEPYGDERTQDVWDDDEDNDEWYRKRYGLGRADGDYEADDAGAYYDAQVETDQIVEEHNHAVHGGPEDVLTFSRTRHTAPSNRRRKGHSAELTAALRAAEKGSLPWDICEVVSEPDGVSSFANSLEGHAHEHRCVGCGLVYEHTHPMVVTPFPSTEDCAGRQILPFHSHEVGSPLYELSNSYEHSVPWTYTLPPDLGEKALPCVSCRWAAQAVTACKAALFGDKVAFSAALSARSLADLNAIDSAVKGYDEGLWGARVRDIASDVVLQKFKLDPSLVDKLLGTGDAVIVEASQDKLWGAGLAADDSQDMLVGAWTGENVLGFALMRTREVLKFRGAKHKQARGQCPNAQCALHDSALAERTLSRPLLVREAHSPTVADLKALEGRSAGDAAAEAEERLDRKYGKVTRKILSVGEYSQEEVVDRISSQRKEGRRREAHASFPKTTPTTSRVTDYSKCVVCSQAGRSKASESDDGVCNGCKRTLTVVQGHVHPLQFVPPGESPDAVNAAHAAVAQAVVRSVASEYPCLNARFLLGKFTATPHDTVAETADSHGEEMFYVGYRSHYVNEPRTHSDEEVDEDTLQSWAMLAEEAGVDHSEFEMPPNTLEALLHSLFANCEKRVRPTLAPNDQGFWRALAEYVTHHVINPKMPDPEDIRREYDIGEAEVEALTEPEWAEAMRGFDDSAGLKELEEFFIRRVRKAALSMHADRSCGWDRHLYKVNSKGALRDSPDAMREVCECAVARLMVFSRCGQLFRFLRPEHFVEMGLCDPGMPTLKNEATPKRKLRGRFKRWRSIMVGSACDELVERVLQKGHSARLQALFNLGADTMSQIGTGSDDRHVQMLKHRVSSACTSAGTDNVVSTDVSGMDFCMSWPGCTTSLVGRVACLEASGGPVAIRTALWNALIGCEFACAQQGLQYGQMILFPTSPGINKSGKIATSANNTNPRAVVSIYCGSLSGSPCGDDCVDVYPKDVDGLARLSEGAARLGYTIRDAERGTPDNFESCSKRYLGGPESPRYSFLNLKKAFSRAVLCRDFNAERACGLLYECRHDDSLTGAVHAFFRRGVDLGLWEDSPLAPRERCDGDMP